MILPEPFSLLNQSQLRLKNAERGTTVFRQDAPARSVIFVLSGEVHLIRHIKSGQEIVIHRAYSGESVADAAIFMANYHCDCRSVAESEVVFIPVREIQFALRNNIEFAFAFGERQSKLVVSLRRRLELMNIPTAKDRVFAAVADGLHTSTIRELAAQIGLTPESTNRALSALVRAGTLERIGRGKYRV